MLIGYARAVEDDRNRRKQLRALAGAGCARIVKGPCAVGDEGKEQLAAIVAELGKGDTLVIWRLDCLADSLRELIALVESIQRSRASLRSISDSFRVTPRTCAGVLMTLRALSDFQYSLIKQRTLQGLREARARGRVGGRPRKLGPREIKQAEAMLNKARMTKTEVADHFGVCRQTLNQALSTAAAH